MALREFKYCPECNKNTVYRNGVCRPCIVKAKKTRLERWERLSTEDKLDDVGDRIDTLKLRMKGITHNGKAHI